MRRFVMLVLVSVSTIAAACSAFQSWDGYADGVRDSGAPAPDVQQSGDASGDVATDSFVSTDAADAGPRGFLSVVVTGGALGGDANAPTNEVYTWQYTPDAAVQQWQPAPALPKPVYGHATVNAGQAVVVLGGTGTAQAEVSDVVYASPLPDGGLSSWAQTTSLPAADGPTVAAAASGYVWVLGATISHTVVRVARLSTNGLVGAWDTTNALPVARPGGFCATASGSFVYVLGGETVTTRVDLGVVNTQNGSITWQQTRNLDEPRITSGCFIAGQRLFVVGGSGLETVKYADIAVDGTLGPWTQTASMNSKRGAFALAASSAGIVVVGGRSPLLAGMALAEAAGVSAVGLDPWSLIPLLPSGRTDFGGAAFIIAK